MITKNSDRQYPLVGIVDFTYADFASGVFAPAIETPPGCVVQLGDVVIDTVFDSGTSDTFTVGDSVSGTRYGSGIDAQSAARTALVPTGYEQLATDNIGLTWTGVGAAPTQGAGRLFVQYVRADRMNENQG